MAVGGPVFDGGDASVEAGDGAYPQAELVECGPVVWPEAEGDSGPSVVADCDSDAQGAPTAAGVGGVEGGGCGLGGPADAAFEVVEEDGAPVGGVVEGYVVKEELDCVGFGPGGGVDEDSDVSDAARPGGLAVWGVWDHMEGGDEHTVAIRCDDFEVEGHDGGVVGIGVLRDALDTDLEELALARLPGYGLEGEFGGEG